MARGEYFEHSRWLKSEERRFLFSFLAALFKKHPSKKMLEQVLRLEIVPNLMVELDRLPHEKAKLIRQPLEQITLHWRDLSSEQELQLQREYASLFLIPDGISPYESLYLANKRRSMEKVRDMVRLFYENAGRPVKKTDLYPADHIAVELDFMAALISHERRRENLFPDPAIVQSGFMREHLGRWAPLLCGEIKSKAQPGMFYDGIARITGNLIELEKNILGIRGNTHKRPAEK
jgi:TorA-specific chaperone